MIVGTGAGLKGEINELMAEGLSTLNSFE